jgi:hypothetical protein
MLLFGTNIPPADPNLDPQGWETFPGSNGERFKIVVMAQDPMNVGTAEVGHPSVSGRHCIVSCAGFCRVVNKSGHVWRYDQHGNCVKCLPNEHFFVGDLVYVYNNKNGNKIWFSLFVKTSDGVWGKNQELLHANAELRKQLAGCNAQLKIHKKLFRMRVQAEARGRTPVEPSFMCPISLKLMEDPVLDPEGNTYERRAIETWLKKKETSPMTRAPLTASMLYPNRALREAIESFKLAENKHDNWRQQEDRRTVLMRKAARKHKSILRTLKAQQRELQKQIKQLQGEPQRPESPEY